MSPILWKVTDTALRITLAGDIDRVIERELSEIADAVPTTCRYIWVDLASVTFFGAVGLGFLSRLAAHDRTVELIHVPRSMPIQLLLKAVELDTVITCPPQLGRTTMYR